MGFNDLPENIKEIDSSLLLTKEETKSKKSLKYKK